MWGFKNNLDRRTSKLIFDLILNKKLAKKYNKRKANKKGEDQRFLTDNVYKHLKDISTIHDSYTCTLFDNSSPWPTKRKGNCFVGFTEDCQLNATDFYECPKQCRPKSHPEWKYC
jgi:hypothetical protein